MLQQQESEDLGGRREEEKVTTQPLATKTTKGLEALINN